MSETKFTPGTWIRYGVRQKLGAEDCIRVGPDGYPIAFIPIGRTPQEQALAIADARLIAAAPDLLTALQDLLDDVDGIALTLRVRERARAAIRKATGDAQ